MKSTAPKSTTAETLNALQRQHGCGPVPLLAAEITALTGKNRGERHQKLAAEFRTSCYTRIDAPATSGQKARLQKLSPEDVKEQTLAGEPIIAQRTRAPGNNAAFVGLKIVTASGWFAARPSGTENIDKIYAESFRGTAHPGALVSEAEALVNTAIGGRP
jgi:phosphoglucomutase